MTKYRNSFIKVPRLVALNGLIVPAVLSSDAVGWSAVGDRDNS